MDKTLNDFRVEGVLGKAVAVGGSSVLFISRPDTDEFCSRNDRRYSLGKNATIVYFRKLHVLTFDKHVLIIQGWTHYENQLKCLVGSLH